MADVTKEKIDKILKDVGEKEGKKKKQPKVKFKNPERRNTDKFPQEHEISGSPHKTTDFLSLLRSELRAPFLKLLEEYVGRCYTKTKYTARDMERFSIAHPNIFAFVTCADIFVYIIWLAVIILVAGRGLAIVDIITQLYCKK